MSNLTKKIKTAIENHFQIIIITLVNDILIKPLKLGLSKSLNKKMTLQLRMNPSEYCA
jgi:hypothetical protein